MAVVHSNCRLCIHLGDDIFRKSVESQIASRSVSSDKGKCDCIQKTSDGTTSGIVKRIFIRERGRFHFREMSLELSSRSQPMLTLSEFQKQIKTFFMTIDNYKPIWNGHRPDFHDSVHNLNLYKVYPAFITQRKALYGNESIDTQDELVNLLEQPCPRLEVIFV